MQGDMHQQSTKQIIWHDPNDLKDLSEEGSDILVETSDDTDKWDMYWDDEYHNEVMISSTVSCVESHTLSPSWFGCN